MLRSFRGSVVCCEGWLRLAVIMEFNEFRLESPREIRYMAARAQENRFRPNLSGLGLRWVA